MKDKTISVSWTKFQEDIELEIDKLRKKAKTYSKTKSNSKAGAAIGGPPLAIAGMMLAGPLGFALGGAAGIVAGIALAPDSTTKHKNNAAIRMDIAKRQILNPTVKKRFLRWARIYSKLKPAEKNKKWAKFGYANLKKEILTGLKTYTNCPHCKTEIKMELGGAQRCTKCKETFFFNG